MNPKSILVVLTRCFANQFGSTSFVAFVEDAGFGVWRVSMSPEVHGFRFQVV